MYLWIIAAVGAYFIKGLCGFANTLVFTSILSFGICVAANSICASGAVCRHPMQQPHG